MTEKMKTAYLSEWREGHLSNAHESTEMGSMGPSHGGHVAQSPVIH